MTEKNVPAALHPLMPLWRIFGGRLYAVGGCVRDILTGAPVHDIDATVRMPAEAAEALLRAASVPFRRTGAEHGGITVTLHGKTIEITSMREDVLCHGRHADIRFTDNIHKDTRRRDFTCNALYFRPGRGIIDRLGGYRDIQHGRLRFIGHPHTRCEEDALRVWRYFRFASVLTFLRVTDAASETACIAHGNAAASLPRERIAIELLKLYSGDYRYAALSRLRASSNLAEAAGVARLTYMDTVRDTAMFHRCISMIRMITDVPDDDLFRLLSVHAPEGVIDADGLYTRVMPPKAQRSGITRMAEYLPNNANVSSETFAALLDGRNPQEARLLAALAGIRILTLHGKEEALRTAARYHETLSELERHYGVFPVSAGDIMPYATEKPQIGKLLHRLRTQWRASGFMATREELLHCLSEDSHD